MAVVQLLNVTALPARGETLVPGSNADPMGVPTPAASPEPLPRPPALPPRSAGNKKLDSTLAQLQEVYTKQGGAQAGQFAAQSGLRPSSGAPQSTVTAIVVADVKDQAENAVRAEGGVVRSTCANLIQADVPMAALDRLASHPAVRFVRPPLSAIPVFVSEGTALTGASNWLGIGLTGAGVKVAVIDKGLLGYTSLLGTELPATVNTSCTPSPLESLTDHGTAVAEIIHNVAPDVGIYLVNVETEVELGNAVDCLIEQGVRVVSHSVGWMHQGPGDGTGVVNSIVDSAMNGGIFWANAAGNSRENHWFGPWADANGDDYLEFAPAASFQSFFLLQGDALNAALRWNDPWGASCNDYDLYLIDGDLEVVAKSENVQDCTGDPFKRIVYTESDILRAYFFFVQRTPMAAARSISSRLSIRYLIRCRRIACSTPPITRAPG